MGSLTGQDNEQPVHRVWINRFELAECQITNADYARFLAATNHRQPLHWNDANFCDPQQPVVAPSWFDAVAYCEWLNQVCGPQPNKRYRAIAYQQKLNGSAPRAAEPNKSNFRGVTKRLRRCAITPQGGRPGLSRSARRSTMPTVSATSAQTCTNGAPTGSTPTTIAFQRIATRKALRKERAEAPAAARGAITQRSRAAPRARAYLQNFNTRIMVLESRVESRSRRETDDLVASGHGFICAKNGRKIRAGLSRR